MNIQDDEDFSLRLITQAARGEITLSISQEDAQKVLRRMEEMRDRRKDEIRAEETTRKAAEYRFLKWQQKCQGRTEYRAIELEEERRRTEARREKARARREAKAQIAKATLERAKQSSSSSASKPQIKLFVNADSRFIESSCCSSLEAVAACRIAIPAMLDEMDELEGPFTPGELPKLPWDKIYKRDRNRWFKPRPMDLDDEIAT